MAANFVFYKYYKCSHMFYWWTEINTIITFPQTSSCLDYFYLVDPLRQKTSAVINLFSLQGCLK